MNTASEDIGFFDVRWYIRPHDSDYTLAIHTHIYKCQKVSIENGFLIFQTTAQYLTV